MKYAWIAGAVVLTTLAVVGISESGDKDKKALSESVFHLLWPRDPKDPSANPAPGAKGTDTADTPGRLHLSGREAQRRAIVVCPGGGYGGHAMDHEGRQIGQWLNNHGITGVILKYRLGAKYNHPIPLTDAQRAHPLRPRQRRQAQDRPASASASSASPPAAISPRPRGRTSTPASRTPKMPSISRVAGPTS